jgi:hypothetical protein
MISGIQKPKRIIFKPKGIWKKLKEWDREARKTNYR